MPQAITRTMALTMKYLQYSYDEIHDKYEEIFGEFEVYTC